MLLNTIGPVWDGNEVWLLTAGGATFAAFPHWYATMFSGLYLPLLIILVALIVRALGFDYRGKVDDPTWRKRWDAGDLLRLGGPGPALGGRADQRRAGPADRRGQGVHRQPVHAAQPGRAARRLTTVALFLTHGAIFIALKTEGDIRHEARRLAVKSVRRPRCSRSLLLVTINVSTGTAASWVAARRGRGRPAGGVVRRVPWREGWAFVGTFVAIALAVATLFLALFPDVMPPRPTPRSP